jgi:hypothetical protein
MAKRTEYKILDDVTEEDLNALAADGWEVVAATSVRHDVRLNDMLTDEIHTLIVNGVAKRVVESGED